MRLKPDEFWRLTYAEFIYMWRGYIRVEKERINQARWSMWHVAQWIKSSEMPDLDSVLLSDDNEPKQTEPKQMTGEAMFAMAKVLNAAFGGEFVEE